MISFASQIRASAEQMLFSLYVGALYVKRAERKREAVVVN